MNIISVLTAVLNAVAWFATVFALAPLVEIGIGGERRKLLNRWSRSIVERILSTYQSIPSHALIVKLFGKTHLSLNAALRSIAWSIAMMFLVAGIFQIINGRVNDLLFAIISHYDPYFAVGALYLFAVALLNDYISIGKSRSLINLASRTNLPFISGMLMVLSDFTITAVITVLVFSLFYGVSSIYWGPDVYPANIAMPDGGVLIVPSPLSLFFIGASQHFFDAVSALIMMLASALNKGYHVAFLRIPVAIPDSEMGRHIMIVNGLPINNITYPFGYYFYSAFLVPVISLMTFILSGVATLWSWFLYHVGRALLRDTLRAVLIEHPFWILWGGATLFFSTIYMVALLAAI